MTKIIVATKNSHKVSEMASLLSDMDIELVTMTDAGITKEIVEDGDSFKENALIKAREVAKISGCPAIADDSGLSVDALGGEPGIYSARYASLDGENSSDIDNTMKLLHNMESIPSGERTARFVSALALVLPDGREFCTIGVCEGHITREIRGNGGFGYDPVFFCPEFSKTFGELSAQEKNSVSHRNKSVIAMKKIIKEIF